MNGRRLLAAACFAILAGCAHERIVLETVEVKVPVPVPCAVDMPPRPERPTKREPPAENIYQAMQRALAEAELWEGWAKKAEAAASKCQLPPKGTP